MKIKKIAARAIWTLLIWGAVVALASSLYKSRNADMLLLEDEAETSEIASGRQHEPAEENETAEENEPEIKDQTEEPDGTEPEQKYAALTFDDGPHPVYTPQLLDGLAQRNVHATFFVIGSNIPGNEEIIERMHREGHVIGNHTYDHVKISDMNAADACAQVEKTSALVREITGEDTEFVRPPFGAWNKALEAPFVMIPVLWDVDPLDWTTKNTAQVVQKVLSEVTSGDIILLHDCYESSVEAALQIIDELQAQGYEFLTVEELILE